MLHFDFTHSIGFCPVWGGVLQYLGSFVCFRFSLFSCHYDEVMSNACSRTVQGIFFLRVGLLSLSLNTVWTLMFALFGVCMYTIGSYLPVLSSPSTKRFRTARRTGQMYRINGQSLESDGTWWVGSPSLTDMAG